MRTFVAVPVPEDIRSRVAELGKEIAGEGIIPVKPQNMHLTLRFIGETPDEGLESIKKSLGSVRFKPFSCNIRGVGVFPSESFVRVVWAGCGSGGALEQLADGVIGSLRGYGGDEKFSAHLTIARVKRKMDVRPFLQRHADEEFGTFEVKEFHLVRSGLGPGGPEYTTLAEFGADASDA